jgi:glycerate 2-kinase
MKQKIYVWAVGKAAERMVDELKFTPYKRIIISPYIKQVEEDKYLSNHPVPGDLSLIAGRRLIEFLEESTKEDLVVGLISGGASSSVVVLNDDIDYDIYKSKVADLIRSGKSIHEINEYRTSCSKIKGGKLLNYIKGESKNYIESDVYDNDLKIIGAGLTYGGNNTITLDHLSLRIKYGGTQFEFKSFKLLEMVAQIIEMIETFPKGVYVSTSEAQVQASEGYGGRNQHLVLSVLQRAYDFKIIRKFSFRSQASDGIDGNSDNAGAVITNENLSDLDKGDVKEYLTSFNSSDYLNKAGLSIKTGPTGYNLLDLQILKLS